MQKQVEQHSALAILSMYMCGLLYNMLCLMMTNTGMPSMKSAKMQEVQ